MTDAYQRNRAASAEIIRNVRATLGDDFADEIAQNLEHCDKLLEAGKVEEFKTATSLCWAKISSEQGRQRS